MEEIASCADIQISSSVLSLKRSQLQALSASSVLSFERSQLRAFSASSVLSFERFQLRAFSASSVFSFEHSNIWMSAQLAISSTVLYSKAIGFLAHFFNFSSAIRATCGSFVYFAGLADLNELHCIGSHYAVLKLDKTNQKCILHISFTTWLCVF